MQLAAAPKEMNVLIFTLLMQPAATSQWLDCHLLRPPCCAKTLLSLCWLTFFSNLSWIWTSLEICTYTRKPSYIYMNSLTHTKRICVIVLNISTSWLLVKMCFCYKLTTSTSYNLTHPSISNKTLSSKEDQCCDCWENYSNIWMRIISRGMLKEKSKPI